MLLVLCVNNLMTANKPFNFSLILLCLFILQQREYYYLGLFVAMSISQGGCGIPFLASTVYDYIATGKCTSVSQNVNPQ